MSAESATFMLIFRESTPERYAAMSADERRERLRAWNSWCDKLAGQGTLLSGNPLHDSRRVVAAGRARGVLDGPFAAESFEAAEAIAQQSPNLPYGQTVEVREVAGGCHLARSLGLTGMREE